MKFNLSIFGILILLFANILYSTVLYTDVSIITSDQEITSGKNFEHTVIIVTGTAFEIGPYGDTIQYGLKDVTIQWEFDSEYYAEIGYACDLKTITKGSSTINSPLMNHYDQDEAHNDAQIIYYVDDGSYIIYLSSQGEVTSWQEYLDPELAALSGCPALDPPESYMEDLEIAISGGGEQGSKVLVGSSEETISTATIIQDWSIILPEDGSSDDSQDGSGDNGDDGDDGQSDPDDPSQDDNSNNSCLPASILLLACATLIYKN